MSMKKTDLEKLKGKKLAGAGTVPDRFGKGAASVPDRREQRSRDREAGLVPFAVKLHADLVREIQARAQAGNKSLNEVTTEIITRGLKS